MSLRKMISAGMIDSSSASMATLAVGFYAASRLDAVNLGWYAIFFTAFLTAAVVPKQLIFLPAEVESAARVDVSPLLFIRRTLLYSFVPAVVAGVVCATIAFFVSREADTEVRVALGVTCLSCGIVSPIQDHVRRMFHLAGFPWWAASTSIVQLASVLGALSALGAAELGPLWIPLGALTAANAVSICFGLTISHRRRRGPPVAVEMRRWLKKGIWLLPVGLLPSGTGFLATAAVSNIAGPATVGFAEAARVVGRPVLVLTLGLAAALRPRSLAAASGNHLADARRISRIFATFTWVIGGAYLAIGGFRWPGNPIAAWIPHAYEVTGLVAVSVAACLLEGLTLPYRFEILGKGRERSLLHIEIIGNVLRMATAATASATRAYAIPLGVLLLGAIRWGGYNRVLDVAYRRDVAQVP